MTCPTIKPALNDFEWYTGECAINNTSGTWKYFDYKYPNDAKEIGTIDWSVSGMDKGNLSFSCTNTEKTYVGDVLTYSIEGAKVTISYFDASENITADINWDIVTSAGSIQVPNYNGGKQAYWDENRQDIIQ